MRLPVSAKPACGLTNQTKERKTASIPDLPHHLVFDRFSLKIGRAIANWTVRRPGNEVKKQLFVTQLSP